MTSSEKALLASGFAAAVVWAFSRSRAGQAITVDGLEAVMTGARRVSDWVLPPEGQRFAEYFEAATLRFGLPPGLLARQAQQESAFRDDIISGRRRSSAGAVGIMQIIPKWHPEIDPGDAAADERAALDPQRAINYAGKLLAKLQRQFGSWSLALAAYNAGPANVTKYGGIPPFPETRDYVADIMGDLGLA
jgi:soluble lytic murein transglycosylase-like protein